uniref:Uncharacterized protein n=1 Tax=Globisporangium ultimum (strain ATCC 200006 / CBS 805.95 / DAOM BR144) TaxID=431595 RepID=K3W6I6_GLOUD
MAFNHPQAHTIPLPGRGLCVHAQSYPPVTALRDGPIGRHKLYPPFYTVNTLRVEKPPMNSTQNKALQKAFTLELKEDHELNDMIVWHDEMNVDVYLARRQGRAGVDKHAVAQHLASRGKNLHVQCGVSNRMDVVLLETNEGLQNKEDNACSVADLFMSALQSEHYQRFDVGRRSSLSLTMHRLTAAWSN